MLFYIYSDAPGSTIDITSRCRVDRPFSVKDNAEEGSVAISSLIIDDPNGDLEITGHRRMYIYESDAPINDQVVFNGFVVNERLSRGPYRTGAGRQWTVDLADCNVLINRRIMNGADANRPAETDLARIQALLTMTELNTVANSTYVEVAAATTAMDAADYRGQNVGAYIDDCRQASGKNAYVLYNETVGQYGLWYAFTYSALYNSNCFLTNTIGEANGTTIFEVDQTRTYFNRDPSRVASGIYLEWSGGAAVYVQDASTTADFAAIDWAAPSVNVKSLAKATARANRYLVGAGSEDIIVHVVLPKVPRASVNKIKKGQLVSLKSTYMTPYTSYAVFRVLYRTVTEISEDPLASFEIEMDLTPQPLESQEQYGTHAQDQQVARFTWPEGTPGAGSLLVGVLASRDTPGEVDSTSVPSSYPTWSDALLGYNVVAGTAWTSIAAFDIESGGGGAAGDGLAMAWRNSTAADTTFIKWNNTPPDQQYGRPRSHQMQIAGLSGAPTVQATQADQIQTGTTYTSPTIAATGAGYIIGGFHLAMPGPHDRPINVTNMAANAPTVLLTGGWMQDDFGGYSMMVYRYVSGAGSYTLSIERTGALILSDQHTHGWIAAFWAGPESPAFPAG